MNSTAAQTDRPAHGKRLVFGATDGTGRLLVRQAPSRGFEVRAPAKS